MTMFEEAQRAIREGKARAYVSWMILHSEQDREGYALRPLKWEGPGEYQHVEFEDGRDGLVKLPFGVSLPTPVGTKPKAKADGLTMEEAIEQVQQLVKNHTNVRINEYDARKLIEIGQRVIAAKKGA